MRKYFTLTSWLPVALLASLVSQAPAQEKTPAGALAITPQNSKIAWVGTKADGKHDGGFSKFTGYVEKGAAGLAGGKIVVEIDLDSIHSDNPKLTQHLKAPDFFDVRKNPKASFKTTSIEAAKGANATHKITGDLTLHGVTKPVTFPAKVAETADAVQLESKFTIDRTEFNMTYGQGKVDNPVTISINVNAKKS